MSKIRCSELGPLRKYGLTVLKIRKFDFNPDLLHAIVSLTTVTAPLVTSVVISLARAKKHVKIIGKNFEISGVSEDRFAELIRSLIDHDCWSQRE